MNLIVTTPEALESLIERSVAKAMDKWSGVHKDLDRYPEILSTKQAQALLGLGRAKILTLVAEGRLPLASGPGEHYRFKKSDLIKLL